MFAISGLVYLVLPGVSAPDPLSAVTMTLAAIAWSVYSLRGKSVSDPMATTAWNFIGTLPLVLMLIIITVFANYDAHLTYKGILLALLVGALASGIGYGIWYAAVPCLPAIRAASVQLTVPIIAAFGGVIFLQEVMSLRLIISSIFILGGIALVIQTSNSR